MMVVHTWAAIVLLCMASTAGDVLISAAMKRIGDLQELRQQRGILHVVKRVITSGRFLLGLGFMCIGFFSLLFALSWADVSLVGPASASLTFVSNAIAARIFLKEKVDRRRWGAAVFVAAGVALLAS